VSRSEPRAAELEFEDWGMVLLHDRRMPGSRGSIDHLAIGPSGVTVIDAENDRGRIEVECRGGLLRERTEHLMVAGRDRTALVDGVLAQADAVRALLAVDADIPIRAMLCFADGDWPWSGPVELRGVQVLTPRRAAKLCAAGGVPAATVTEIAGALDARLALA